MVEKEIGFQKKKKITHEHYTLITEWYYQKLSTEQFNTTVPCFVFAFKTH